MSQSVLPKNARMLSLADTLRRTGSTEPCYQVFRADGTPIVGDVTSLRTEKETKLPGIGVQPSAEPEPEPECFFDKDGNEVGPWIRVETRAEKRVAAAARKAGLTFQIRDD